MTPRRHLLHGRVVWHHEDEDEAGEMLMNTMTMLIHPPPLLPQAMTIRTVDAAVQRIVEGVLEVRLQTMPLPPPLSLRTRRHRYHRLHPHRRSRCHRHRLCVCWKLHSMSR